MQYGNVLGLAGPQIGGGHDIARFARQSTAFRIGIRAVHSVLSASSTTRYLFLP